MSEKSADRTTRRLMIAVFGLGGGLGFIGGTLFGFWLVSRNGLIRTDEAVWQPVEGVTATLDGRPIPIRSFYTHEGYQFFDFGDTHQWLFDDDNERLYVVGNDIELTQRDGRWIARGLPLWKMTMENAKIDHDPQLFLKQFTRLRIIRFLNTSKEKVEITVDFRQK